MDERARRVFRTFMVGSAVAASLATLEAANDPVLAATGLTTSPSVEASGSSPAVTLSWTTSVSPADTILVDIGSFTTSATPAPGNCLSSAITLRVGNTTVATTSCGWNPVTRKFTLQSAGNFNISSVSFAAGVLTAGAVGTNQISVNDVPFDPSQNAIATMTFTPASGPNPPDWFQSYQRGDLDETCAPTWNPSWAMWANHGTGGYVCVRTQYYDPALAAWSYR